MGEIGLRKCPFCGGIARIHNSIKYYWIECKKCETHTKYMGSKHGAINRWNRRK